MADVFISYARTERAEAEAVKARLEAMGLSVFLDVDGLDGGDIFSDKLDREVKTAGLVLGLWSPHALTRPWVQIECDIGKRRGVLIPVAIKPFRDLEVPASFWNIQFVDLTEALHSDANPNWITLQRSIARTLNRPDIAPRTPTPSREPLAKPTSSNATGELPTWARTQTVGALETPKKPVAPRVTIALLAVLSLVGAAGAFWYFGPMQASGRVMDATPSESEAVQTAEPVAPDTRPNPLAAAISGTWAGAGLDCSNAVRITSAGDQLIVDYGGVPGNEVIEGSESNGSLRTRANGVSYFYSVAGSTLTLRASDGSSTTFSRCGS